MIQRGTQAHGWGKGLTGKFHIYVYSIAVQHHASAGKLQQRHAMLQTYAVRPPFKGLVF